MLPLTLLSNIPTSFYKYAAIAIVLASSIYWVYNKGVTNERSVWLAKVAAEQKQVLETKVESGKVDQKVVTVYVDRVTEVIKKVEVVREKIKTIPVVAECPLPVEFIRVHDEAVEAGNARSEPTSTEATTTAN